MRVRCQLAMERSGSPTKVLRAEANFDETQAGNEEMDKRGRPIIHDLTHTARILYVCSRCALSRQGFRHNEVSQSKAAPVDHMC